MPRKILYVSESYSYGGAQRYLLDLITHLDRSRFQAKLLIPHHLPLRLVTGIRKAGVEVVYSSARSANRYYPSIVAQVKWLCTLKPDLVHFNLSSPFQIYRTILAAWISRLRALVATFHLPPRSKINRWVDRLLKGTAVSRLNCIISVSQSSADLIVNYLGVSPNRIAVIHNGIAIEDEDHGFTVLNARVVRQELRLPESGPIIISVGRLTRQKGHEYLVRAAPTIIQQMPDARIVVVGDGRLRSDLESMAVSGKVEHCVKFVGERTDVNRLLAIADLFVLPSLWESFPFSVLEAMAASLPVVASSVDGLPEVVVRGQTGLLVAPGDANQLASAVIFLLTNPKLALSLGDAGRKRVQTEFPVQKMVRQTEEVYEACLA